ncbi:ubiquinone biosynthesis hydrox [Leucogyrophana mollusca]|uniref:Ubiquinone biosynthesis hydrox n=1 Tax=Leucogyrophana mollusca TaxID=85980 RepID=A0ACB8BID5_9AGAM|nr:ubiquinone biosynthesis hydrox [Leucogyrophana mollusca]
MASLSVRRALKRSGSQILTRQRRTSSRAYSSENVEDTDVVIVGGGPAGLALASALTSHKIVCDSLKVTLVEAGDLSKVQDWSLEPNVFSNRVSSITNSSRAFLEGIGVWDYVDEARTTPIQQMQVWDGVSDARITFDASDIPLGSSNVPECSHMAQMTENLNLQRALLRRLSTIQGLKLLQRVKVDLIQRENRESGTGWPLVHLSDGSVLRTRLLVGADGFNSPVRSYAGISSYGWSYDTQAIVATLNHFERSPFQAPNNTAYQRFLPTGPIAFLPLSPTVSSLVWSTKPPLAAILSKSEPGVLECMINAVFRLPEISVRYLHQRILDSGSGMSKEQIQEEIAWRERSDSIPSHSAYASASKSASEGGIPPSDAEAIPSLVTSIQAGTVASFPLRFNHADSYIGEGAGSRTVLIGDAAHTVHPLAGQGLNLGLGDVEALTRCIIRALGQGADIGSYTALIPYARERYFENHKVMAAVDKLHKLYSSTAAPVVWARSVGVEVLNELDSVKAALMMNAGAYGHTGGNNGSGWNVLARGVEVLAGTASAGKMLGAGLSGVIGQGLQTLLKSGGQR